METCVRGFSYMPEETKMEMVDLKYIEREELERAWKTTRRQRLKEQEQKVWEEFVREQDVIKKVYDDDPYQFLHQLPEDTIKELLDKELENMKTKFGKKSTTVASAEQPQQGDGDSRPTDSAPNTSFEEDEKDEGPMFHIFDDDGSVDEDEVVQSSPSVVESQPNTVREKDVPPEEVSLAEKSSENIGNVIQNSIYCARVKDLRLRIFDEIVNSINMLERLEVMSLERGAAARARRRAAACCTRFHTHKLYPLQRQLADIERINSNPAPFGKHTQFQSLMVRVVSLHQNVLLAYQVLVRNFEQTFWLEQCAGCVRTLADFTRRAAAFLHPDQELLTYCNKLDEALDEYVLRVTNFFNTESVKSSSKKKLKRKMRPLKTSKGKEADHRLSMYSMDTLRLNSKSSMARDLHSAGTSKKREQLIAQKNAEKATSKTPRKSPRVCRRPLMRAPSRGPRAPRLALDVEVPTMVEDTNWQASNAASRAGSPSSPAAAPAPAPLTPKSQNTTPRQKVLVLSPRSKRRPQPMKLTKNPTKPHQTSKVDKPEISPKAVDKSINSDDNNHTSDMGTGTAVKNDVIYHTIDISDENKLSKFKSNMQGGTEDERPDFESIQDCTNHLEDREKNLSNNVAAHCEVTRLLKQLCSGGDQTGAKAERVSGAKNAQLHCITGTSPRPPSTPQLLRILEETIQKKVPRSVHKKKEVQDLEKYRLTFNIPEQIANNHFQYRTKFVQHMLASAMYANSAVGRPWEIIGSISEQLIDELLTGFSNELQMKEIIDELYECETN